MRWVFFLLLAYAVLLLQTTLVGLLTFHTEIGSIMPELLATVAVFVALQARGGLDAMIAGWILGLGLDLFTGGGPSTIPAVGPMAVLYSLAAGGLFKVRDAFFRDWKITQALLALGFCAFAHIGWVTWQSLLAGGDMSWGVYGSFVLQAVFLSVYTAVLAPVMYSLLFPMRGLLFASPLGRAGRSGR